ncbi:MAG: DNA mismatch repair endonuclease MutL, partial [Cyanobacteria bacterium P01_G01_bin.49]
MSPPIQPLPTNLVNLIAASEVIDSFAAVVRELVENSLDAGATRLVISLFPKIWQVKVADNGRGMALQDLRNCGKPHSTSKIREIGDLGKITSLGFRGEALHSITQVAELVIISRCLSEDAIGWCLHYDSNGEAKTEAASPIAPGTIVTVSKLFERIPLRRQGLPALSQQLKAVQKIIENIALCHPQITWQVQQNHQPWFSINPGKTAQQILPQFLKGVHFHDLQHFSQKVSEGTIEVVLGLPDRCHRGRADWVKIGMNGRIVRSLQLEQTVLAAFSRTLPKHRFPICFIHLKLSPNQIDWNRH